MCLQQGCIRSCEIIVVNTCRNSSSADAARAHVFTTCSLSSSCLGGAYWKPAQMSTRVSEHASTMSPKVYPVSSCDVVIFCCYLDCILHQAEFSVIGRE